VTGYFERMMCGRTSTYAVAGREIWALTISNYSRISHAAHSENAVLVVRVRHQGATSFELVPHSPTESLEMVEWLTP